MRIANIRLTEDTLASVSYTHLIEKHGEENIMELEELKNIGNSIGFFKVEELNIDCLLYTSRCV